MTATINHRFDGSQTGRKHDHQIKRLHDARGNGWSPPFCCSSSYERYEFARFRRERSIQLGTLIKESS
ncbi:MAG: hypothetical protein ACPL1K_00360, partial [Candidatus Kryptoniota bacterium]